MIKLIAYFTSNYSFFDDWSDQSSPLCVSWDRYQFFFFFAFFCFPHFVVSIPTEHRTPVAVSHILEFVFSPRSSSRNHRHWHLCLPETHQYEWSIVRFSSKCMRCSELTSRIWADKWKNQIDIVNKCSNSFCYRTPFRFRTVFFPIIFSFFVLLCPCKDCDEDRLSHIFE